MQKLKCLQLELNLADNKSSRALAAQLLVQILQEGRSLNSILHEKLTNRKDRSFIQEICYGVIRWYWQLDGVLNQLLTKPLKQKDIDIQALLLTGLYQLIHLQTAPHAVLNETVQAARELKKEWATKFINGVLRQFLREQNKILEKTATLPAAKYSHPQWLLTMLVNVWPCQWEHIVDANNQRPPMTLRVNRLQNNREEYLQLLQNNNIEAQIASHTTSGIILKTPCDVTALPGFMDGKVSVQDAAAQLAAGLLDLQPRQRILDACAAPGGKTAHLLETEPNLAQLLAIDIDDKRCKKITENLQRLKLENADFEKNNPARQEDEALTKIQVLSADAKQPSTWWDGKLFDRILLDAPCSATGVIRRHPDIKYLRRKEDIAAISDTQLELLNTLWALLKPGGILLYATCSILPQENSQVLEFFLNTHADAMEKKIDVPWGTPLTVGRQIITGNNNMDGFYYGRLEKIFISELRASH